MTTEVCMPVAGKRNSPADASMAPSGLNFTDEIGHCVPAEHKLRFIVRFRLSLWLIFLHCAKSCRGNRGKRKRITRDQIRDASSTHVFSQRPPTTGPELGTQRQRQGSGPLQGQRPWWGQGKGQRRQIPRLTSEKPLQKSSKR
jgi:hypothetical protein